MCVCVPRRNKDNMTDYVRKRAAVGPKQKRRAKHIWVHLTAQNPALFFGTLPQQVERTKDETQRQCQWQAAYTPTYCAVRVFEKVAQFLLYEPPNVIKPAPGSEPGMDGLRLAFAAIRPGARSPYPGARIQNPGAASSSVQYLPSLEAITNLRGRRLWPCVPLRWPKAGSTGINHTENYTHSSAELAKEQEKYLPLLPHCLGLYEGWLFTFFPPFNGGSFPNGGKYG